MKIGPAIRQLREERGLTLDELAFEADTTKSSLSRIENGTQTPSLGMLCAIATQLGVKVYQIMALAEGDALPVAAETPDETSLLSKYRAMEPEARDTYAKLAAMISSKGDK